MIEIELKENSKINFYDDYCLIIREDALTIENKFTKFEYEKIKEIKYLHRRIWWIISFFKVLIFLVIQYESGNPISGEVKKLEITLKDGSKRTLDVDSLANKKIHKIIEEFNKKINSSFVTRTS